MSVDSVANALGGLVVGYAFDEASGTTLEDFGPNNLDATLSTNGTVGGTAVLPGYARSLACNGVGTGGAVATRAVSGGSPLQVSEITVGAFVRPSSLSFTASHGYLGRRDTNWLSRFDTSRRQVVILTLGGVQQTQLASVTGLAAGDRAWVWFSFDGTWLSIGVNDVREQRVPQPGSFNAVTTSLAIGNIGGLAFDGQMGPYMIFDRALELGEHRALTVEGDVTIDRPSQTSEAFFFDNCADDVEYVEASTQDRTCLYCGGLMREEEGQVSSSDDSLHWHPGCRGTSKRVVPYPLDGSSVQADVAASAERLAREILDGVSRRPTSTKGSYFNGSDWVNQEYAAGGGLTGVAECYNVQGAGVLAASLGRWVRAGSRDPLTRMAMATVDSVLSRDSMSAAVRTAVFWDNGDFTYSGLGRMLVLLDGIADPAWHAEKVAHFLTRWDVYNTAGGTKPTGGAYGGNGPGHWYINGNREIDDNMAAWAAWRLDPTSDRWDEYDASVEWTEAPTAGSWQPGGSGSGLLFGFVTEDEPSEEDGSDGKGWFRENHGASPQPLGGRTNYGTLRGFWNVGATVDGDALAESVDVDGRCYNYTFVQAQSGGHLWLFSGEDRWARYLNMLRNKEAERLTISTGIIDPQYSSRHTNPFNWTLSCDWTLTWRGKRAVPFDMDDVAEVWRTTEAWMRTGYRGSVNSYYRIIGRDLAQLFMGLDDWPGH